jgi:hypothetical protein
VEIWPVGGIRTPFHQIRVSAKEFSLAPSQYDNSVKSPILKEAYMRLVLTLLFFIMAGEAYAGCGNLSVVTTNLKAGAGIDKVTFMRSRFQASAARLTIWFTDNPGGSYTENIVAPPEEDRVIDFQLNFSDNQQSFRTGEAGKTINVMIEPLDDHFQRLMERTDLDESQSGQKIFYAYWICSDQFANTTIRVYFTEH